MTLRLVSPAPAPTAEVATGFLFATLVDPAVQDGPTEVNCRIIFESDDAGVARIRFAASPAGAFPDHVVEIPAAAMDDIAQALGAIAHQRVAV